MSLETKSFEFGEFLLDAKEKVLLRHDKPVPITPKTYQLLLTLLENQGHVVEKDELMSSVWADSFVEDGNLSFTIRLLRKALDDDTHHPRFIETIPRRGYRFIAEVLPRASQNGLVPVTAVDSPEHEVSAATPGQDRRRAFAPLIVAGAVFVFLIAVGAWQMRRNDSALVPPILNASLVSEVLTTGGNTSHPAISPDGKNMAYVNLNGRMHSIWLRQLDSGNTVEIVQAADYFYGGLAFSPDANFIYFTRVPLSEERQLAVYRVSIFGGIPSKIVSETQGWISISPDGEKISFVRCYYRDDENCSLWIAGVDGKNEKKLASRQRPIKIGANQISPDGRSVAFAVGQSENAGNEFGVAQVDIETSAEREMSAEKFFNVKSLAWLPEGNGLLVAASRVPATYSRIWHLNGDSGDVRPIINDSESYTSLSIDRNAETIVSMRVKADFQLRLHQTNNPTKAPRTIAGANDVAFAPDGRILFSSIMTGNSELWTINSDGSSQRQLTNDKADDFSPVASRDNQFVFFSSNRSGEAHVWRMNVDGSGQVQVTVKEGGFALFASPDGRWLYYRGGRDRKLWRVSAGGGQEELVLNERKYRFAFSPDGKYVAYRDNQPGKNALNAVSLAGKNTIGIWNLPDGNLRFIDLKWTPDGKHLDYLLTDVETGRKGIWRQTLAGGPPLLLRDLGDEGIHEGSPMAFSPDGSTLALIQGAWKHDAVLFH